jgi:hypothetical protein
VKNEKAFNRTLKFPSICDVVAGIFGCVLKGYGRHGPCLANRALGSAVNILKTYPRTYSSSSDLAVDWLIATRVKRQRKDETNCDSHKNSITHIVWMVNRNLS